MSCNTCQPPSCASLNLCAPEDFGSAFPSLIGPMGPPGGPGTFVENYTALRALDATVFTAGYISNVGGYAAVGDGGGGQFEYDPTSVDADNDGTILRPTNGVGRWLRLFSGPVYGPWFGMKADGVTNDITAYQSAIDGAGNAGLLLPPGQIKIVGSLNYTDCPSGFVTSGAGVATVLRTQGAGKCIIDCTGNSRLVFRKMWVNGESSDTPDAGFLLTRKTGNGSAGVHTFEDVQVKGHWDISSIVSLSSERNTYDNVQLDNGSAAGGAACFYCHALNDCGVTSDFQTIPVLTGGNTVHTFIGGDIRSYGSASGIDVDLKDVRDISFHGTFFAGNNGSNLYGISVSGTVSSLHLLGCSAEWMGTYGIYVAAAGTLINSTFSGTFDRSVFGANTSLIKNCFFWGPFFGTPGINAYDLVDCYVSIRNLAVTVRNKMHGCTLPGSEDQATDYSFPTDVLNNQFITSILGGDGINRGIIKIGDETKSRLNTFILKAKGVQRVVKSVAYSANWTPSLNDGSVFYMKLTGDTIYQLPGGTYNAAAAGEGPGMEVTFVFEQDAIGGHNALGNGYRINIPSFDTTANTIALFTYIYVTEVGWILKEFQDKII